MNYDDTRIAALVRSILAERSRLAFTAAQRGVRVDDLLAAAITEAIRHELFPGMSEHDKWQWAVQQQGYTGTFEQWQTMDPDEREDYELGAQGINAG